MNVHRLSICAILTLTLLGVPLSRAQNAVSSSPTFLLFKYQHSVGEETDKCDHPAGGLHCTAHFELQFTGDSVPLDAEIETGPAFSPKSYVVKGRNSTRSDLNLEIKITGKQAEILEDGKRQTATLPQYFFTLVQNAPLLTQELLFAYWNKHGHPSSIKLLPAGEVRIKLRGENQIQGEHLQRYSIHGVTWGNETVWLNAQQQIAAVIGTDAEEDRFEALRPQYAPAMKQLVQRAAADAVADLMLASRKLHPVASGVTAFTHATVINPDGSAPLRDTTVVIRDGKIAALGQTAQIPPGATVLDASNKFILPGLWDTHAHFEQWEWALAYIASGITSVRDVGNEIEFLVPLRKAINSGQGLGPYMYGAGLIDSDPGSLTSEHAEDAARVHAIVSRYHDLGFEEMKIYQSLKPELVPVVAAEAHQLKMQVTGHIPTGMDALQGVSAGMDQINHIGFAAGVMRPKGSRDISVDSPEAQKAIRLFLDHHTVIEPTLARSEFNLHPRRQLFSEIEPSVTLLPPEMAVILNNAGVLPQNESRAVSSFQLSLKATRLLHGSGIPVLAGSDQVVPGHSLHRELELLVQAGLTPLEAISCATTTPAAVLGVSDELGTIAVGKRADLVVLDADPLQDIRNIRRVHWTVTRGRIFAPGQLWPAIDFRMPGN
jgi:imidazolonepropionase-like amidohydrolase